MLMICFYCVPGCMLTAALVSAASWSRSSCSLYCPGGKESRVSCVVREKLIRCEAWLLCRWYFTLVPPPTKIIQDSLSQSSGVPYFQHNTRNTTTITTITYISIIQKLSPNAKKNLTRSSFHVYVHFLMILAQVAVHNQVQLVYIVHYIIWVLKYCKVIRQKWEYSLEFPVELVRARELRLACAATVEYNRSFFFSSTCTTFRLQTKIMNTQTPCIIYIV